MGCSGGVPVPQAVSRSSPSPHSGRGRQAQGERNELLKLLVSLIWQKCVICVSRGKKLLQTLVVLSAAAVTADRSLLLFGDEKCGFRFTVERDELIGLVNLPLIKKSILILQLLEKNHLVGILFPGGTVYRVNEEQTRRNLLLG